MPTYDYECESCGHQFEQFQSITARPTRKCPECGRMKLHRLIGAGAGVIFKGSGFYQTDYRSESYKQAEKNETKSSTDKDTAKKKDDTKTKDSKSTDTAKSVKEDKKKSA
ncbi:MAG: FmdB family transcriptional regulator [Phycisphaerae bacterium SG8_4]|nr:MAG: FmdB family transcriptional regulator [Phycisphaerae bacterium SG8_4]